MFGYELIDSIKLDNLYSENRRLQDALIKEKERTQEILDKRGESIDAMVKQITEESKFANEYSRRFLASEDARRSLGDKIRKYSEENKKLKDRIELLEGQLRNERAINADLQKDYDELAAKHEVFLKSLENKNWRLADA